jgi:phytoene dehydrogenase-like protein
LRYDAAIIGGGAEGLAAAVTLARSGLKVVVLERNERPGGRHVTREFHPGFFASPFADECSVPPEIFWQLGLAEHRVLFRPSVMVSALWPDRAGMLKRRDSKVSAIVQAARARAAMDAALRKRSLFARRTDLAATLWPGAEFAMTSLTEMLAAISSDGDALALALADALEGRMAHPDRAGSALHLLIGEGSGSVTGGLQSLTDGLVASAQRAGVEISYGLEVLDIRRRAGRVDGVRLADGSEIAARAVISTLDLKRALLSLFAWNELPHTVARRAASFRMGGGIARLLFALDALPPRPRFADTGLFAGAIHIAPARCKFGDALAAWHAGTLAEHLPIAIRFPSASDPRLCPAGAAVMTATVSGVPSRLFDGAWTHEKRAALRDRVLSAIEQVLPGTGARVRVCELVAPPDIEQALSCTDGDLWGGEIAADQMLAYRPGFDCASPRTPIAGFYLAGPSTAAGTLGTCVSGVLAARAVIADLKRGWRQ